MGGVISLYKPTTTLEHKVLGFVWCTLGHRLFPKAMDNQPENYSNRILISRIVVDHGVELEMGIQDFVQTLDSYTCPC